MPWGKAVAPRLAPVGRLGLTAKAETYLAILQGKGSGTGWDLGGETAAAVRFLPSGRPLVLDVGANRGGRSSSLVSRVAPQQIDLVLFEPVPACIEAVSTLGLPNARVVEVALSDRAGDATIFADEVGCRGRQPLRAPGQLLRRHDRGADAGPYRSAG